MKEISDPANEYLKQLDEALADVAAPKHVVCGAVFLPASTRRCAGLRLWRKGGYRNCG